MFGTRGHAWAPPVSRRALVPSPLSKRATSRWANSHTGTLVAIMRRLKRPWGDEWRMKFAIAESLDVNRRKFIAAALGTVCAPFGVMAQQPGRIYRIGWLDYSSSAENLGIFVQAMG